MESAKTLYGPGVLWWSPINSGQVDALDGSVLEPGAGAPGIYTDTSPSWHEDEYVVKSSLSSSERAQVYGLRARVFCRELRWVPESADGIEQDEFDRHCAPIGVFTRTGNVVATARVAFNTQPWMLDRCFRSLLPSGHNLRRCLHAVEISRLALDPGMRNRRLPSGFSVAELVYKSIFTVCMFYEAHLCYAVVSAAMWRHMRAHGLTVTLIGPFQRMDDGVRAGVVEVNWKSFIEENRRRNPERLSWYTRWAFVAPSSVTDALRPSSAVAVE